MNCRGCGKQTRGRRNWHPWCLRAYRKSVPYRVETLRRDGAHCARCPEWRNRWALFWLASPPDVGRCPCGREHRGVLGRTRRVIADHNDPIGGTGTQSPTNLQILCRSHDSRKTRVDIAKMRGRRVKRPGRVAALVGLMILGLWVWSSYGAAVSSEDPGDIARVVVPVLLAGLVLVGCVVGRARTVRRIHEAMAETTGASRSQRHPISVKRWSVRDWRWAPAEFVLRYPHTFKDDGAGQGEVEDTVARKFGGTWMGTWDTGRDRVRFRSPDPLADPRPLPWPNRDAPRLSLWDPIPVGVDPGGRAVTVLLPERNVLIGGEPGAGKSASLSLLLATAALDPDVTLHLIDGKRVELAAWEGCAADDAGVRSVVGPDPAAFADLLARLQALIDQRYDVLLLDGKRKVERDDGHGLHVVVIDELAYFTLQGDRKVRDPIVARLTDVIQRGRAAGVIVLAATQRPSAEVIPTQIRDLFGFRWAMRCSTPGSSDMVLGQGNASRGFSAARIPGGTRGIGLLLAEGTTPDRLKSYYLSDEDLGRIARRAEGLRRTPGRAPLVDAG